MANTTLMDLMQMDAVTRFEAINELVCDVLWAFSESRLKVPDIGPAEFQACASVIAALDPKVFGELPTKTPEERISNLNDASSTHHDREMIKVLDTMVITRLQQRLPWCG